MCLKINWFVKTPSHELMEVARSALWSRANGKSNQERNEKRFDQNFYFSLHGGNRLMEVSVRRELTAFLVFSTRLGHVESTVIAITSNRF